MDHPAPPSATAKLVKPTRLQLYLSKAAEQGFAWGKHDCCTFIAGWAEIITGHNPADPWRDAYCSEAMAETILAHNGGLGPALHKALTAQGWKPVTSMHLGDISMVMAPVHDERAPPKAATAWKKKPTASIFTGRGRFALVSTNGLVVAVLPFLMGWRHPDVMRHVYA